MSGVEIVVLWEFKEGEVHTAERGLGNFSKRLQRIHWEMGGQGRGDKGQVGKCAPSGCLGIGGSFQLGKHLLVIGSVKPRC